MYSKQHRTLLCAHNFTGPQQKRSNVAFLLAPSVNPQFYFCVVDSIGTIPNQATQIFLALSNHLLD